MKDKFRNHHDFIYFLNFESLRNTSNTNNYQCKIFIVPRLLAKVRSYITLNYTFCCIHFNAFLTLPSVILLRKLAINWYSGIVRLPQVRVECICLYMLLSSISRFVLLGDPCDWDKSALFPSQRIFVVKHKSHCIICHTQ